jgi:hypothetical protein
MDNFQAIGQLVIKAQDLLDSIKGGAIRVMQTQFDTLKQTITSDGAAIVANVDTLGRNKLQQLDTELAKVKQSVDINSLSGEARYVTEITVNGDKDTFYPVFFTMPSGGETEIQICRSYSWNNTSSGAQASDFNATHVSGVLVVLRGQASPWSGNGNYLRTLVNKQRYRQSVANIGFLAYCVASKSNNSESDTVYNRAGEGYVNRTHSGFMLRGGKLKYQIISNKKITFDLKDTGDILKDYPNAGINVKWTAKALSLTSIEIGDADNNFNTNYIGHSTPKAVA